MRAPLTGLVWGWLSQDVARTNAAQAAVRLRHRSRQVEDVDAFLAAQHRRVPPRPTGGWPAGRSVPPRLGRD